MSANPSPLPFSGRGGAGTLTHSCSLTGVPTDWAIWLDVALYFWTGVGGVGLIRKLKPVTKHKQEYVI